MESIENAIITKLESGDAPTDVNDGYKLFSFLCPKPPVIKPKSLGAINTSLN